MTVRVERRARRLLRVALDGGWRAAQRVGAGARGHRVLGRLVKRRLRARHPCRSRSARREFRRPRGRPQRLSSLSQLRRRRHEQRRRGGRPDFTIWRSGTGRCARRHRGPTKSKWQRPDGAEKRAGDYSGGGGTHSSIGGNCLTVPSPWIATTMFPHRS